MRTTQQMSVTLPTQMAALIKSKVNTGQYASESEVIRDGMRALLARDNAIEHWLKTKIAATYDELKSDPSKAIPIAQVKEHIAAKRRKNRADA